MAKELKRRIVAEFSARNKAKGVMAGFRRGLDSTGQAMKRMAKVGAVMTLAAAAGVAYMVKRQMEAIDVIAKLSDRLGIATEDLVGLQHAASISGVSAESLNKSLDMFVRRLGEMTMGSGEAERGLEMLGLTMEELIHLSPAEAMGIAADRINRLETQAEKAAAAYFLFGRAGAQLVTMFAVGSEGLREFQIEAEKLGLTFSRWDAAQIEAANDALTRARATMTGLFRQVTIELAPYIEAAATAFVDFATAGEGVGANVVNAFEAISLSIARTAEEVERLIQKLASLTSPVDYMKKMTEATREAWKRYRQETGESMAGKYTLGPLYAPVQPKDKALFDRILAEERAGIGVEVLSQESRVRAAFENIRKKAAGEAPKTIEEQYVDVLRKKMEMIDEEIAANQKKIDTLKQTEGFYLRATTEAHREAADEIDKVWTEMWLKQEETAYHAMRAPIIEAEELAVESAERRKRIAEDIALSMASSWSNAIDQMMFEGMKFWTAMEDMARSLFREIVKIIMYKKLAEPMAYGLMGLPVPEYQHGTIATRPHLAMVGEVPEAIVPLSGGRSIPVEMRGGGGGNLDVHIHNEGEGKFEISEVEEYAISDQRIIDVTIRAAGTHGPYRRSIKQASR